MRARPFFCRLLGFWLLVWLLTCSAQGALTAELRAASAIAYDAAGNLYIADGLGHRVWEATLAGALTVVAGTGVQGYAGDGGLATQAELNGPLGVAVATDGSLWIADTGNNRVRRVGQDGTIRTVAGTGVGGFHGDGGVATEALLRRPTALAVEPSGAVLLCDTGNERVRRISSGTISTVVGSGVQGSDDGAVVLAGAARLDEPLGVAAGTDGSVLFADSHNHRIRRVTTDGRVVSYAGTGIAGFAGDGASALAARLLSPQGLAALPGGGLLVADAGNQRLRKIDGNGVMWTLAGSGVEGFGSDGALESETAFHSPRAVAVTGLGMPAVADTQGAVVRVVVGGQNVYLPAALSSGRTSRVTASASSATYGESAIDASVAGNVGLAQGSVAVMDAGDAVGTSALGGASAHIAIPGLSAGTHMLQIAYGGDGLNPASSSALAMEVQPRALVATATSATTEYGAVVPALVGDLQGVLPQDMALVRPMFAVQAGADPVAPGVYPISATLTGQGASNYKVALAASSGALTVTRATSAVSMPSSNGYAGLPVMLAASVLAHFRGVPTGTVTYMEGGTVVASAALLGGQAQVQWTPTSTGAHQISAVYMGDANFLPSVPLSATINVSALPDFQLTAGAGGAASVTAGAAVDVPFTVASLGGPFTGAVSFSAVGLPDGARVSFSPPQVVPGAAVVPVLMHVETRATSTANNTTTLRPRVQMAGCLLAVCVLLRRRRAGFGMALILVFPLMTGCGARSVGAALGAQSKSYSVVLTGTGTDLAGRSVARSVPITFTVKS